jgi:hypothetical protein
MPTCFSWCKDLAVVAIEGIKQQCFNALPVARHPAAEGGNCTQNRLPEGRAWSSAHPVRRCICLPAGGRMMTTDRCMRSWWRPGMARWAQQKLAGLLSFFSSGLACCGPLAGPATFVLTSVCCSAQLVLHQPALAYRRTLSYFLCHHPNSFRAQLTLSSPHLQSYYERLKLMAGEEEKEEAEGKEQQPPAAVVAPAAAAAASGRPPKLKVDLPPAINAAPSHTARGAKTPGRARRAQQLSELTESLKKLQVRSCGFLFGVELCVHVSCLRRMGRKLGSRRLAA